MAFGGNFTKILVTLGSGGVRRSSWALEYVEFHGGSISGTPGAIPRDLGGHILKKPGNFRYFPQKMRYANLQVSTTLTPTVVEISSKLSKTGSKIEISILGHTIPHLLWE